MKTVMLNSPKNYLNDTRKELLNYDSDSIINFSKDVLYLIILLRQQDSNMLASKIDVLAVKQIEHLVNMLRDSNYSEEEINKAKYLICAAVDEAYAEFCRGSEQYSEYKSLISSYYNEAFGGDNFFKIVEDLHADVFRNLSLIKLSYILLSLGFRGKYGIKENGAANLHEIRIQLKSAIEQVEPKLFVNKQHKKTFIRFDYKFFKLNFVLCTIFISIILAYAYFFTELQYHKTILYESIKKYYL